MLTAAPRHRHHHWISSSNSSSRSSARPWRPLRQPPLFPATDSRLTDVSTAAPPHQDTSRQQLEDAYRQRSAAPSPAPPAQQQHQAAGQQQQQQQQSPQPAVQQQAASLLQARARGLFVSRVLPVLRVVRAAERKLGPLVRVGNSILLMTAVIMYDLGVNNVLDRLLGDSPAGSVSCVIVGLGMVVGVKLSGSKVLDFWEV